MNGNKDSVSPHGRGRKVLALGILAMLLVSSCLIVSSHDDSDATNVVYESPILIEYQGNNTWGVIDPPTELSSKISVQGNVVTIDSIDFSTKSDSGIEVDCVTEEYPTEYPEIKLIFKGSNVIHSIASVEEYTFSGIRTEHCNLIVTGSGSSDDSLSVVSDHSEYEMSAGIETDTNPQAMQKRLTVENIVLNISMKAKLTTVGISAGDKTIIKNSTINVTSTDDVDAYNAGILGEDIEISDSSISINLGKGSDEMPSIGIANVGNSPSVTNSTLNVIVDGRALATEDGTQTYSGKWNTSYFSGMTLMGSKSIDNPNYEKLSGEISQEYKIVKTGISHKVTYDLAGGKGDIPAQSDVEEGKTFTVTDVKPTRDGYTFEGWNDGSKTYQSGDKYTVGTSDVVLKAVWKESSGDNIALAVAIGVIFVLEIIGFAWLINYTRKKS